MTKSCKDCPGYLSTSDSVTKYQRSIGTPVCQTLGKVLGKPGLSQQDQQKLLVKFADQCPSFGQVPPPSPRGDFTVMLPDLSVRTKGVDPTLQGACKTCATCVNHVAEETVAREIGYTAGLCVAKGRLILGHRKSKEATNCMYREFGQTVGTTGGLFFLPEYQEAFVHTATSAVRQHFEEKSNFVDPIDYSTDREVSEEDQKLGIRAWRRIGDPGGSGNEIYLPIFSLDFFNEQERDLVPRTGDDEHPELYIDHFGGVYGLGVAWLELDETPCLIGEPGTGKTELYRHMAWLMCAPFRRISISESTELDDLFGKYEFIAETGTDFKLGMLPLAWTTPGVLCIDEPNTGRPAVWQRMRPLTDNSKQLVMDMWDNRMLNRHDECYMGMAMNPAWDVRNVGTLEIADADANRLFHFWIDLPPAELEKEILRDRVKLDGWELSEDQVKSLMSTASSIRALTNDSALPITWALRQQIKVARALRWFNPIEAYSRACGDYLEPQARETLMDQVRSNWKLGD